MTTGARCVRSSDGRRALAAAPGRIRVITRARLCRMTYGRPSKVGGAVPLGAAAALLCCSAAATASAGGAQCTIIEGWDLTGNDLLGRSGKPLPQPCPGGPGDCCEMCATKPEEQEPKGKCGAWSFNHGSKTCWMKTQNSTNPTHNGDTSGILADPLAEPWPNACTSSSPPGISQTRCPASQTCCKSLFSASALGCCPWPNAVCCANGLTCW